MPRKLGGAEGVVEQGFDGSFNPRGVGLQVESREQRNKFGEKLIIPEGVVRR